MSATPQDELQPLLEFIKRSRGFDFTGYRRSTLERRLRRRMDETRVSGYGEYLDRLEVDPHEFAQLFDAMLVNVTAFFRDPDAWDYLDAHVLPQVTNGDGDGDGGIRVWSAGCSSGEETYSISMLLVRQLGEEAFRERVKVYGTDVDAAALATARRGVYAAEAMAHVPGDLRDRCFARRGSAFAFVESLRPSLIFGRNDLVQDAPVTRIDVLICRNVLIYFNTELQTRVLRRFNMAMTDHGCLFLGKPEILLGRDDLFTPIERRRRIFAKVPVRKPSEAVAPGSLDEPREPALGRAPAPEGRRSARIRDGAFDLGVVAQVVVDATGSLAMANHAARTLLGIEDGDLERPLSDLPLFHRPVALRSAIEEAFARGRTIGLGTVAWSPREGEQRQLEVQVSPVRTTTGVTLGTSISYQDVTRAGELRDQVAHGERQLELSYEEMQASVEELELSNEELQSAIERLETANDELESSNEELRTRSLELDGLSAFHDAILGGPGVGLVVVGPRSEVEIWNRPAEELWGLRSDAVLGRDFLALDVAVPTDRLRDPLRAALRGEPPDGPVILESSDGATRRVRYSITLSSLILGGGQVRGAIIAIVEQGESRR